MEILNTDLSGVLLLEAPRFGDDRGFFSETFRGTWFPDLQFVQDNHSTSCRHTLRGLHFQRPPHAQDKLVRVVVGDVFDVAVDLRHGSPTFGRWVGFRLSADRPTAVLIPKGFAHGFCVLSRTAEVLYKCTDFYAPECEGGLAWDDPDLGIHWPTQAPLLSDRDRDHPRLRDLPCLFRHDGPE